MTMKLQRSVIATSLTGIIFIAACPCLSKVGTYVDERHGTKMIIGFVKLNQNVSVMAMVYMGKHKDENKWIPTSPISIGLISEDKAGKTGTKPDVPEWKLLKPRDRVTIHTAKRKIIGHIYGSDSKYFAFRMKPSDFKDFARSRRATVVCGKTKLVFDEATLADMRGIAVEMEK